MKRIDVQLTSFALLCLLASIPLTVAGMTDAAIFLGLSGLMVLGMYTTEALTLFTRRRRATHHTHTED